MRPQPRPGDWRRTLDYEVTWSGKGAMPHESGKGWEQRYRPEVGRTRHHNELPSQQDMQRARHVLPADTGIGIGSIKARLVEKARCRGCGQWHPVQQLTAKLTLCHGCRAGRQRAVRYA